MLLTITLNPAIDRVLPVPGFQPGTIFRTADAIAQAGGKGLNVARAAHGLGLPVRALAPLAGAAGQYFAALAAAEPFDCQWLSLPHGETRMATLIVHPPHDTTVINESGPDLSPEEWALLAEGILRAAHEAEIVAFSGSLPGRDPDPAAFAALLDRLLAAGCRVAVDTSGAALRAVLERPLWLLKINASELGAAVQEPLEGRAAICAAARRVQRQGVALVIVTDGPRGAALVAAEGAWWAAPPPVEVESTIGAGDSTLAGFCAAWLTHPAPERALPTLLGQAVAAGTADALSRAPGAVARALVEELAARVMVEIL